MSNQVRIPINACPIIDGIKIDAFIEGWVYSGEDDSLPHMVELRGINNESTEQIDARDMTALRSRPDAFSSLKAGLYQALWCEALNPTTMDLLESEFVARRVANKADALADYRRSMSL